MITGQLDHTCLEKRLAKKKKKKEDTIKNLRSKTIVAYTHISGSPIWTRNKEQINITLLNSISQTHFL